MISKKNAIGMIVGAPLALLTILILRVFVGMSAATTDTAQYEGTLFALTFTLNLLALFAVMACFCCVPLGLVLLVVHKRNGEK